MAFGSPATSLGLLVAGIVLLGLAWRIRRARAPALGGSTEMPRASASADGEVVLLTTVEVVPHRNPRLRFRQMLIAGVLFTLSGALMAFEEWR